MKIYHYNKLNCCQALEPRIGTGNLGKCIETYDLFIVPLDSGAVAICFDHLSGRADPRQNRHLRPFRHLAVGKGFVGVCDRVTDAMPLSGSLAPAS